jgi:hypothetical protein
VQKCVREPLRFDLPHGEHLTLGPVTPQEDPFLLSVYGSTRKEELDQVEWDTGQREAFLKWQFDLQRGEYEARFPDAEYYVILIDDRPAGRIWIGTDEKQRGAGTALLRWLIGRAKSANKPLRHMAHCSPLTAAPACLRRLPGLHPYRHPARLLFDR